MLEKRVSTPPSIGDTGLDDPQGFLTITTALGLTSQWSVTRSSSATKLHSSPAL